MDRVEIKYLFSVRKFSDLIDLLDGKYKVLEVNNLRALPYHTTYLDTPDYLFFNQHARGELKRHKIRYREYESTGDSFLEIKMKTNKRRTVKWRIINNLITGSFDDQAVGFMLEHLPYKSTQVSPVLVNRFTRVTLIGLESEERITIDFNIYFSDPIHGLSIDLPFLTIVELKRKGYSHSSPFINLIKKLDIRSSRFSKYCTGNAILNDFLKINNMKPTILLLNKIEHEYNKCNRN